MTLLDNPAISGLAPQIGWALLNPNDSGPDPAHPLPGAYTWAPLDDVFIAVDRWNGSHSLPQKTIQLIVSAGFSAPGFVADDIDDSVCGSPGSGCGSCDGWFMATLPVPAPSPQCGYTTLFWQTEGAPIQQEFFPLPWNTVYKTDHEVFLKALNKQIKTEPSSNAFVAMVMAGPTATSPEMILPNSTNQNEVPAVKSNNGYLTLPNGVPTISNLSTPAAWNILIGEYYGAGYVNSDEPFVIEWDAAIDLYSGIFHGITLELTTTTDSLPDFPDATTPVVAADGFTSDCGKKKQPNAQQCAAVTQVISYFANPTVGGDNLAAVGVDNAKLTWEAGMTAARISHDLGTNAVKWLSATTEAGLTPLPGTPYNMSRVLAGMQFSHSFSSTKDDDVQAEGCPTYPKPLCTGPDGTTASFSPSEGLENVLQLSYFNGTKAGYLFGASDSVTYAKWVYSDAPMNFLEIYDDDVLYASGLSKCNMLEIAGNPDAHVKPDVSVCSAKTPVGGFASVALSQTELNSASQGLSLTLEPPLL
jgi:hypothetical protein